MQEGLGVIRVIRRVKIAARENLPKVIVKAPDIRVAGPHMPFPDLNGVIAGIFHGLSNAIGLLVPEIIALFIGPIRIAARHDRRTCRGTFGIVIELAKSQALICQTINVWGFDFTAVTADIGVTHIVDNDQYDVGPVFSQ